MSSRQLTNHSSRNSIQDSLKDPNRPAQKIEGLTDFLIDEYRKRLGIYCEDSKKLFYFWKNYVSQQYREQKQKNKTLIETNEKDRLLPSDIGLGPDAKTSFNRYNKKANKSVKGPRAASALKMNTVKPKVQLNQGNIFEKYEQYSNEYELDVIYTIEKDCNEIQDSSKQQQILQKKQNDKQKKELKLKQIQMQISNMLKVHFDYLFQEEILKHIDQNQKKLAGNKNRAQSAKNKDKMHQLITDIDLQKSTVKKQQLALTQYQKDLQEKSDAQFFEQKKMHYDKLTKNMQIIMHVVTQIELTNDVLKIIDIYSRYKDIQQEKFEGTENEMKQLVCDVFSDKNKVLRLFLYKLKVNNCFFSKYNLFFYKYPHFFRLFCPSNYHQNNEISLQTFYITSLHQDKLQNLFYIEKNAIEIIQKFEEKFEQKRNQEIEQRLQLQKQREQKKDEQIKKNVFGDNWDPDKGIIFQNRKDYTEAKDTAIVGNQLAELRRKFPHDRVIQRMIKQEFKSNKIFKYPEEYEIYDDNIEKDLKKNFIPLQDQKDQLGSVAWKVPNFTKEKTVIEDFKQRDYHLKKEQRQQKLEQAQLEENLEQFLQEQAFEYSDWMQNRKEKKTNKAYLIETYHKMIELHKEAASKRFPHLPYGQDPNSESFKKSIPDSFKRYFYRIVNSIHRLKNGKKVLTKNQTALILLAGTRRATQYDPLNLLSKNTKLQNIKIGQIVRLLKRRDPNSWRTRVFKREDFKQKLKNIFMKVSEQENCTFEPEVGALNRHWTKAIAQSKEPRLKQESVPGEFFERMGENFCKSNPAIYKQGKLKKALTFLKNGDTELCLNTMCEGFDLTKVFQHYQPKEHKIWADFNRIQNEKPVQKNVENENEQNEVSYQNFDLSPDQIDQIKTTFVQIDVSNLGFIKIKDLDEAFRKNGILPKDYEMEELYKQLQHDGHQSVDQQLFMQIMTAKIKDKNSETDFIKAFQIIDRDKSGSIDKQEFEFVFQNIGSKLTNEEIDEMIKQADVDGNGEISQEEFINIMKTKKKKIQNGDYLAKMKEQIQRYILREDIKKKYNSMGQHIPSILNKVKDQFENELKLHPDKKIVYVEDFQNLNYKVLYEEAWNLFKILLSKKEDQEKRRLILLKQQEKLNQVNLFVKKLKEEGISANCDLDENEQIFKNIFKTIMCPLKNECKNFNNLRWTSSKQKTTTKFGKECPYAHHPMELQFPETLGMRIQGNKNNLKSENSIIQKDFKFSGTLFECKGCCTLCNLCKYKKLAQQSIDALNQKTKNLNSVDLSKIDKTKADNERSLNNYIAKFGILKKASVLLFFERVNDAFDEIAKAAQIIKSQQESIIEHRQQIQNEWQQKLGLPEGLELPKPVEKITKEDLTEEFYKKIDVRDKATLYLYIKNVCPQISGKYDRDSFLDQLIQDLYFKIEDIIIKRKENIEQTKKNLQNLTQIQELIEIQGDRLDPASLVDNKGNPLKMKTQNKEICENIQKKKLYKDEGIEMKTEDKYFVDTKFKKRIIIEGKKSKCVICPSQEGVKCSGAHYSVQLDLVPNQHRIKNLQNLVKASNQNMIKDKPLLPFKPSAKNFQASDLPDFIPKKQKENDESFDDQKRKGILDRENVFRKPYQKE